MSTLAIDTVRAALKTVKYPGFSRDIVSFGLVRDIAITEGNITVKLEITTSDPTAPVQIKQTVEKTLTALAGNSKVEVQCTVTKPQAAAATAQKPPDNPLPQVQAIIAVASGKGGVGKSTMAVNLTCALAQALQAAGGTGRVGLMDCDIYGPSVPLMLGMQQRPDLIGDKLQPIENFGIKTMSMGLLVDEHTPIIWRGPMVMKTIQQFVRDVAWGELDILVVDLPPGTGDAQLSLVQTLPLNGAVIVTTPQTAAVEVVRRGARMFAKVNVPLLGVVENMSYLPLANGDRQQIFGEGGGQRAADDLQTALLGQLPLDPIIREGCDQGIPVVVSHPDAAASQIFAHCARAILAQLPTPPQAVLAND